MAEQILYSLKIEGTQTELERLAAINDEIVKGKENLKELAKTDKAAAEQQKLTLKEQQSEYRNLQKEIERRNKAEESGVQTLEKMRAQLSRLYKELDNTQIGSKRFQEITVEASKLRNEIGKAEEASGRFQRNVGNYQNAIQDAFAAMGVNVAGLTQNLARANSVIQLTTASTGGLSGAMKVLRLALISTGIGAIVVLLGTIVTYLTSTQEGIDKINSVLKPLGTVLQRTLGIVQELGSALFKIFSGEAQQGWTDLKTTISGVGDELEEAWKQGQKLYELSIEIRNISLAIAANEGRINREIAEQRQIVEDVNKSDAERIKAGKQVIALQNALTQLKQQELDKRIEELKIQQAQNDTDVEGYKELVTLINERDQLQADNLNKQREVQNKLNAIEKKRAEDAKAAIIEQSKLQQQADQYAIDAINALLKLKAEIENDPAQEIFKLPEEEEIIDETQALIEIFEQQAKDGLQIVEQINQDKKGLYDQDIANLEAAYQKGLISTSQYEEAKLTIRKEYNQAVLSETADLLNQLADIFGKESKAGKAAAIAATAINTYVSAMEAFKSGVKYGGPLGIPLGIAAAAVATAFGVKQIQQIVATKEEKQPRYARGVIGVRGAGSETSDSIDAKISRGESVMTAKATKVFAPVLAQMEQAVGNTPNVQIGSGRFANGIINLSPRTEFPQNYERIIKRTIEAVGDIPVVVAESDITGTQNRVRRIKVAGDL